MSLFGTIQLASNAMQAQQIGLQVVGQNIANANTPGYSREKSNLTPAGHRHRWQRARPAWACKSRASSRMINNFLNNRLWGANADAASGQAQQSTYQELEGTLNALGTNSIGSQLNQFMASINNVLDSPQEESMQRSGRAARARP